VGLGAAWLWRANITYLPTHLDTAHTCRRAPTSSDAKGFYSTDDNVVLQTLLGLEDVNTQLRASTEALPGTAVRGMASIVAEQKDLGFTACNPRRQTLCDRLLELADTHSSSQVRQAALRALASQLPVISMMQRLETKPVLKRLLSKVCSCHQDL
jgi:hypothetical protein